jgi:hypothetical protein
MSDMFEKLGIFYLGKNLDLKTDQESDELLLVKNKNLTTHAAIIGMTGSGKTGLGVGIIEEAVLDKIPSIIIDPKGDMGNLLLAFDDFNPKKFEPWVDEGEADKKGLTLEEYATKTASMWQSGLEGSGQGSDRVKRFKDGADFTIYTPGSTSGIPLSVLSSFDAPSLEVLDDPDTMSYMLNSTVSSILALIGIDADPLKSREYLLLTTIFNYFWKKEQSITLEALIGHVANPPFEKIGVLSLKSFYSQNDRLKLAMLLNNVLASPTFSAWIEGESLDIASLLYTSDLKPRVSILSISHLNDNERMFFVTLFLNKYISWMRTQSGSSSLKTLLYMDEIYGFFPSTSNPPSKNPMLLLLKQARAFGVGVVLSTQNPVDLDYKGLSNIGSWFIGRLQTKQDVDRVIDGLTKSGDGSLDKKTISSIISNLKKRVFLYKSVHDDDIKLFSTRWVMSYLRGPISKKGIATLMRDKKEALKDSVVEDNQEQRSSKVSAEQNAPILSQEIDQFFIKENQSDKDSTYSPYLLANATVKYYDKKRSIDEEEEIYLKYYLDESQKDIEWDSGEINEDDFDLYDIVPISESTYSKLPEFISGAKNLNSLEKEFSNYLYHNKKLTLFRYSDLKLESDLYESLQDFNIRAIGELKDLKEEEIEKLQKKFEKKRESFEKKHQRALEKLQKEEDDVSHKTTNTLLTLGMAALDFFSGRGGVKRSTLTKVGSTLRSGGRVYKEKGDVERAKDRVAEIEEDFYELEEDMKLAIQEMDERFMLENYELEEFYIKARRADIYDLEMAILWSS